MTRRTASPRRAAFTLVEVLIVVVIIALLASLLLVAINRVAKAGAVATANNDITQLNLACEAFKNEFKVYPPSQFTVPTQKNALDPNYVMLATMFSSWGRQTGALADGTAFPAGMIPDLAGQTLNGNQSMVYFLGGPAQTGWAVDKPIAPSGSAVKGPFYDFKQDRLADGTTVGLPSAAKVFLDPFKNPTNPAGKPFAYFGSATPGGKYPAVNCFGVAPFVETATNPPAVASGVVVKYMNQGGVQIISAGENGQFGPGCPKVGTIQCLFAAGQSNPGGGVSPYGEGDDGADDLANFNNGNKLGVGK